MSAFLKDSEGKTRWELAFGKEFLGPHYLLGHLGFVRTKDAGKFKFSPNAEPAVFVDGDWTLEWGTEVFCNLFCTLTFVKVHHPILYPNFMTQRFICLKM
jgi:hypothetical protein